MPYEDEIEVNSLPQGTTPNYADKVMLIDSETGTLKLFSVASLGPIVSDISFTNAAKNSLIALLEKVAYIDGNGQQYLNELISNLAATVTSISAVFTQGQAVIYDTDSLDVLKQYLVVTATYSDSSTAVVSGTNYTLSGTLTEGTSTITAAYGGKTDTFTVTVTSVPYVANGLIAYWDGIDNTGSGHDGTVSTWTDLVSGYELPFYETTHTTWGIDCVNFDGNNTEGLKTSGALWTRPASATIEVVLAPSQTGVRTVVCFDTSDTKIGDYYQSRRVLLYSDSTVGFVGDSDTTYTLPVGYTAVKKLAATYDGFTVDKAYVNGSEVIKGSDTHTLRADNKDFIVGSAKPGFSTGYPYKGKIYAIRVYNRKLSAQELAKNLAYDNTRFGLGLTL